MPEMPPLYWKQGRLCGDELRQLRALADLTQKALARLLCVTPQTINRWERDKSVCPKHAEILIRLLASETETETGLTIRDAVEQANA